MFANRALADTYELILREAESAGADRIAQIEVGRRIWSHGFVADAIDEVCRNWKVMDVSGRPHGGLLTGQDMASSEAYVEAPIFYDYGRFRVLKPDTWTQGLAALQQLALLKGFDLDRLAPIDLSSSNVPSSPSRIAIHTTAIQDMWPYRSRHCCLSTTMASDAH